MMTGSTNDRGASIFRCSPWLKRFLACVVLAFSCLTGFSQKSTLEDILASADDTAKVTRLSDYSKAIAPQNPQQAREIAEMILSLSKRLHYNAGIAAGNSYLGYFEAANGKHRNSIYYYCC